MICASKGSRTCKPINPDAEYLLRTIWEQKRDYVWASSNKIPVKAKLLIDRGWAKIKEYTTPSQNQYGKYFWLVEITPKGRREYNGAQNQRHKKMMKRQVSLWNGRKRK